MSLSARLASWWASRHAAWDDGRWLVLDVEASGLDAARDRLLAIAAIAVHIRGPRIVIAPGDSFEVVLKQPDEAARPDKANILLHGIGVGAQRGGVEPVQALAAFAAFAGRSPLLAFHAAFDRTLIERGYRAAAGAALANPWLDLEPLAAVLYPDVKARALDEWMAHFGISCAVRHQAAADTMATAELLLKLWPRLATQLRERNFRTVSRLAAQRRWVQA
jgi:DNA polymerase-3 subunit epsilon